jgi:hypothetical protein
VFQFSVSLANLSKIRGSRKLELVVLLQIRKHKARGYHKIFFLKTTQTRTLSTTQSHNF